MISINLNQIKLNIKKNIENKTFEYYQYRNYEANSVQTPDDRCGIRKGFLYILTIYMIMIAINSVASYGADDIQVAQRVGENYKNYIYEFLQFSQWESRFGSRALILLFSRAPFIVFIIFNSLMMMLLIVNLYFIVINQKFSLKKIKKNIFIILFIFLLIPWTAMSSAGWMATSITYLWAITLGSYIVYEFNQNIKISWLKFSLLAPVLFYTVTTEFITPVLFLYFFITNFLEKNKLNVQRIMLSIIFFGGIILAILWPGNTIRFYAELRWFPDFLNYSLIDKAALGITSTAHNLIFNNVYIFWFLIATIFIYIFNRNTLSKEGIIYGIIFCYCSFTLSYYFSSQFPGSKGYGLNYPDFINYTINYGAFYHTKALICSLIFLLVPIVFFMIYFNLKLKLTLSFIYLLGLTNRIAVCLSPTLYASSTRTFFFFYITLFLCTIIIIQDLKNNDFCNSVKFNIPNFIAKLFSVFFAYKLYNIFFILTICFFSIFYYFSNIPNYINLYNIALSQPYSYNIEQVTQNSKSLTISGWVITNTSNKIYYPKHKFILYNVTNPSKSILIPHFSLIKRKDVSSFFKSNFYDNSGFKIVCKKKFIDPYYKYKLGILYEDQNNTKIFIMSDL